MKKAGPLVLAGIALAAAAAAVASTLLQRRQDAASTRWRSAAPPLRGLPPRRLRDEREALSGRLLPARPAVERNRVPGVGFVETALDKVGRPAILVVPAGRAPATTRIPSTSTRARATWDTAIADELPRVVDARFRTIRSRPGRALVGVSAGGYGAMHLALEHLEEFAVVESWSGYFHPTDPTGTKPLDLGSDREEQPAPTCTGS